MTVEERTRGTRPPWLGPGLAFATTIVFASVIIALDGPPVPRTHDEFAYVLAGDTFAHGRLTNPSHPLWRSFETFHVLSTPTYAAKYHPAQGLFLALGQVLFGRQWIGVVLSCGLASAAIAWMLSGRCSWRATATGALVASTIIGCSYWAYSFWGGAVAAGGGALVVGAFFRVKTMPPKPSLGIVCGSGISILLFSRPLEGGLLCGCVLVALLRHAWQLSSAEKRALAWRVGAPTGALASAAVLWLLYYQHRVTGDALLPPYLLYERTYFATPPFVWGDLREPVATHARAFDDFARYNLARFRQATNAATAIHDAIARLGVLVGHYLLVPAAIALPFAVRDRDAKSDVRFATVTVAVTLGVMVCSIWSFPHYVAPLTGLFVFLIVRGLEVVAGIRWRGRRVGAMLAVIAVVASVLGGLVGAERYAAHLSKTWHRDRAALEAQLSQSGERHLVIVRYEDPHDFLQEWVENRADIDGAPVVFARELDRASTDRLLAYFKDRHAWLLTVRDGHHALTPFAAPTL